MLKVWLNDLPTCAFDAVTCVGEAYQLTTLLTSIYYTYKMWLMPYLTTLSKTAANINFSFLFFLKKN